MNAVDLLRHGRKRIEAEGLLKGRDASLYSGITGNGCCVQTSMFGIGANGWDYNAAYRIFMRANDVVGMIINWNDDPARTKEEVLAAFDKAITLAEQEGA